MKRSVISVYVENKYGVVARVSGLFMRRGFNIDSFTGRETNDPRYSRITIALNGDDYTREQTVKQLIGQNQGVSNIEITDPSIKEFEKIARKYGVDYAVKKDRSSSPPKYLIFFKGLDADALTAAFTEYTGKKVRKAEKSERPSVLAKLSQFKELVKHAVVDRNKRKELER